MYFEFATKRQLLTIAFYEDCDLDYKYQAAYELQVRKWHDSMLPQLIRLWGEGMSVFDISIEMEIPEHTVRRQLVKWNLYGKRVKQ